ncbi:MAG: amidohydrolase [Hyphomonas sp.]|nr:amidohydrolase [Hyphomonas sp.]
MRHAAVLTLAFLLAACVPPQPAEETAGEAVTVYTGGTIYTGDPAMPQAGAVEVGADGRIQRLIPVSEVDRGDWEVAVDTPTMTVVDLKGGYMFPGFVDSHVHLKGVGQRELTLNLEGTASIGELVTRVEAELADKAPGELLVGRGWIETGWPEARMPSAADLDAVSPGNPVFLVRADGHAMVANSAALAAADILDLTGDPPGGHVERGPDGKATGIVIDYAMMPVYALAGAPTEAEQMAALETGARTYVSRGWTGGHNMSVDPEEAPLMTALDKDGRLPLRLYNAFGENGLRIAEKHDFETDTIRNRAVKLYMDGALGSRGALLIAPYADRPETSGLALLEPEALHNLMMTAKEKKVQLAIHAIGDLANRRILDTFDELDYGPELRWRIEHTQILAPEDISRVGGLGLIASMQPSHAIGDLHFAPARLGMDRLAGAYAWRDLLKTGAVVTGGSDAPVEVGSPLIEFYAAVARKDLTGFSGEGWHPEQALSREEALALFTSAPAFASFTEDDLGTIAPGKLADFTVFDRDLMTVPEAEILDAKAMMTVVGGEIVYRAD